MSRLHMKNELQRQTMYKKSLRYNISNSLYSAAIILGYQCRLYTQNKYHWDDRVGVLKNIAGVNKFHFKLNIHKNSSS